MPAPTSASGSPAPTVMTDPAPIGVRYAYLTSTLRLPTWIVPALCLPDIHLRAAAVPPLLTAASRASRSEAVAYELTVTVTGAETWVPAPVFSDAVAVNVSC